MREILFQFRGETFEGEFIEGIAVVTKGEGKSTPRLSIDSNGNLQGGVRIKPGTLSLRTPYKDKNGNSLYVGDKVQDGDGEKGIIEFNRNCFVVKLLPPYDWDPMFPGYILNNQVAKDLQKIGGKQ